MVSRQCGLPMERRQGRAALVLRAIAFFGDKYLAPVTNKFNIHASDGASAGDAPLNSARLFL